MDWAMARKLEPRPESRIPRRIGGSFGASSKVVPQGLKRHREKGLRSGELRREHPAGAKARVDSIALAAPFDFAQGGLLKSCPVTEPLKIPAGTSFSGACRAQADSAALAAPFDFAQGGLLKSCPDTSCLLEQITSGAEARVLLRHDSGA
jgi:hypothetical protein